MTPSLLPEARQKARAPQSTGSAQAMEARLAHAQELLMEANARAVAFVRKNPVPCLIGAAALGYLIGRAASRRLLESGGGQ